MPPDAPVTRTVLRLRSSGLMTASRVHARDAFEGVVESAAATPCISAASASRSSVSKSRRKAANSGAASTRATAGAGRASWPSPDTSAWRCRRSLTPPQPSRKGRRRSRTAPVVASRPCSQRLELAEQRLRDVVLEDRAEDHQEPDERLVREQRRDDEARRAVRVPRRSPAVEAGLEREEPALEALPEHLEEQRLLRGEVQVERPLREPRSARDGGHPEAVERRARPHAERRVQDGLAPELLGTLATGAPSHSVDDLRSDTS